MKGAATGSGGEIRDEGATGIGAQPKAGLTGYSVSYLRLKSLKKNGSLKKIALNEFLHQKNNDRGPSRGSFI